MPISSALAVTDRVVYAETNAGHVIAIAPVAAERLAETTTTTGADSNTGTTVPPDGETTSTTARSGGGSGGTF